MNSELKFLIGETVAAAIDLTHAAKEMLRDFEHNEAYFTECMEDLIAVVGTLYGSDLLTVEPDALTINTVALSLVQSMEDALAKE